jgi:RimJ/RimL family protein N-acetyltransferase
MITNMEQEELLKGNCSLRLVEVQDAEFIVNLRTHEVLSRYISSTSGDVFNQRFWITTYKEREKAGSEYYYIIENLGAPVGTVRLYDFIGDSFCWGSWIIVRAQSTKIAYSSVIMVYDFAFNELGFNQSHFDVTKGNDSVLRFHTKMGANIVRSDEANNYLEISSEAYFKVRPHLLKIVNR